ncbi:hypothetical protein AAF712_011797 [Marasmius tenuissimus]|uniref:DUF6534 domain-containing protein n=1 Tax=Marasmius tenuissimus TaxID=585030 RepID=A0ABR2ZK59_9AGAR
MDNSTEGLQTTIPPHIADMAPAHSLLVQLPAIRNPPSSDIHVLHGLSKGLMVTYDNYTTFAKGFGNMNRLNEVGLLWIDLCFVDGLVAFLVEGFYAWRIWILSRSKALVGVIMFTALVQLGGAIAAGIRGKEAQVLSKLKEYCFIASSFWLGGSAVCDIIIACSMTWVLYRTKSTYKHTQNIVRRIILLTMETGTVTALAATFDLIFFLIWPDRDGHVILGLNLAKLYCNSLLVILNSRIKIPGARGYEENTALMLELSTGFRTNFTSNLSAGVQDTGLGGRVTGNQNHIPRTEVLVSREAWSDRVGDVKDMKSPMNPDGTIGPPATGTYKHMQLNAPHTFDQFYEVCFIKQLVSSYHMERQRVDDSDLSRLIYSNGGYGWNKKIDDKAEYLSTSHGAQKSGSTVTFRFNGTSVQVKGTILQHKQDSKNRPYAEFALDSNMITTFDIGNSSNNSVLYQQTFYNSPSLPAEKEHILTIALFDPDEYLWIDYIDYIPVPGAAMNTPATSSTLLTNGMTSTPSTTTNGVTVSSQPQNDDSASSISKSLVSGVSISAAVMMALLVALVWRRRRRRLKASGEEDSLPITEEQFSQGSGPMSSISEPSSLDFGSSDQGQAQQMDVSPPPYRETA